MELYVVLFVSFTTGAVISIIANELLTATGSPLDTIRSIIQNMWRAAAAGAVFTLIMVFIFKTVRLVSRCLKRLPFRSLQGRTESDQSEKESKDSMKSCETKESMKYEMRPVTLAMAVAAAGAAFAWAWIVTSFDYGVRTGDHRSLFGVHTMPDRIGHIFSHRRYEAGETAREQATGKSNQRKEGHPGSPQDQDTRSRLSRTPATDSRETGSGDGWATPVRNNNGGVNAVLKHRSPWGDMSSTLPTLSS